MTVATPRVPLDSADHRHRATARPFKPLDIASDRCKGCELCVHICPKHVLALDERVINRLGYHPVYLSDAAACTSCALCARICPDVAFAVFAPPKSA